MNVPGVALWLMPPPDSARHLRETIASLASRLGTPRFEPHVTLLTGIESDDGAIGRHLAALAKRHGPIELRPLSISESDAFYRCVVIEIAPDETLLALRREAEERFRVPAYPFEPHLSLVYGELPRATRRSIAEELGARERRPFAAAAIEAVAVARTPDLWTARLRVDL